MSQYTVVMPLRGRGRSRFISNNRQRSNNVSWHRSTSETTGSNSRGRRPLSGNRQRGSSRQRGRPNRMTQRSTRNDRQTDDTSNISSVLQTILERLDSLESNRREATRDSSRITRRTTETRNSTQDVRSNNPDFSRLIRLLFQYSQIAHHQVNWTDCPRSISRQIDSLVEQIQPPLSTPDLRNSIVCAANDFRAHITALVQSHLENKSDFLLRDATNFDISDLDRACEIASRQLNTRLGKRLHKKEVSDAMSEISSMLKRARPVASHSDFTREESSWTRVKTRHPKPSSSATTARNPTRTSNRFEALAETTHQTVNRSTMTGSPTFDSTTLQRPKPQRTSATDERSRPSAPRAHTSPSSSSVRSTETVHRRLPTPPLGSALSRQPVIVSSPPLISPVRSPSTHSSASSQSSTRPSETQSQEHQPSKVARWDAATASDNELCEFVDDLLRVPVPRPDIRIHPPMFKNDWSIQKLKAGMTTVLIADSNGLSMAHANLPDGWTLDAFRGAQLSHVSAILKRSTEVLRSIDSLIVAVGLNDRLSDPSVVTTSLLDIRSWARENGKRLFFASVPVIPGLPTPTKEAICHLNDAAADLFDNFIPVCEESEIVLVPNDSTGLHYDNDTAELIVGRIIGFLYRKC